MSHRIFRLSIASDDAPEVRRVLDFDGRSSLHDVHEVMCELLNIGDDDHQYAFFLSGKYWDQSTQYVDPRTDGTRADQALLFRLRLKAGQRFVYVYDFGSEHRYSLTVVSVTETDAALPSPVLVESLGEAPVSPHGLEFDAADADEDDEGETNPALREPYILAAAVVELAKALDNLPDDAGGEEKRPLLRKVGEATLAFALSLDRNLRLLTAIERKFAVLDFVLDLPARLSVAQETDLAVRVAEALLFCAADEMKGEIALAYARSGARPRALELVLTNLETAQDPFVAECKAGEVYRELGEADAAEAYYRRSLAIADTDSDRRFATLRIASLMIDANREAEAAALVAQQAGATSTPAPGTPLAMPSVGRNDPCPCGSGKKYKKCHGA